MATNHHSTVGDAPLGVGKASVLRALHIVGDPLVVPNAWDAASARLVESAGFPVVATSSFATSEVLGYPDGEEVPVEEVLAAAARMVRAVHVPVTVDFERGYQLSPTELVERFAETGAVGMNLEDSNPRSKEMIDAGEQADFLAAIRAAALSFDVDLVINARTDSFVREVGSPEEQVKATLDRGGRYLAAGVDSIFAIGVRDPHVIRTLVKGIAGPINVVYGDGTVSLADFAALGVARVSFGPSLQRDLYRRFGSSMLSALVGGESPFTA
jgi:2-methylisocitrate lyase-like PEP mutase family enzyme